MTNATLYQSVVKEFKTSLLTIFEETFEKVQGVYLDRGTSLFETLAGISAETASRPVSATCATLAAQVEHTRFYMDHLAAHMRGENPPRADWGKIWNTVSSVTPEEWETIKSNLRTSYEQTTALFKSTETWAGEDEIGNAMAIMVHSAYHLGEIRQALCTLNQAE
jgi:hypothetical protein